MKKVLLVSVLAVLCSACGEEPPPVTASLDAGSAYWRCEEEEFVPTWEFGISIVGPVNEGSVRVWVDTADGEPATEGFLMTVQGSSGSETSFVASLGGTETGDMPLVGQVPYSCDETDQVLVRFCASTAGNPMDVPCWACGEGSDTDLPETADAWLACN